MHLTAAVIGLYVGIGYERDDKVRLNQMRGDALLPLAADFDALVIPDVIAPAVQVLDDGQHLVRVGVGIAYENIRLGALIGLEIFYRIHGGHGFFLAKLFCVICIFYTITP